jgi:hypothetical protein
VIWWEETGISTMWKTLALAVAALAPAVAPGLLHVAGNVTPVPAIVGAAPAAGQTFAPTCHADQVLDSRPDPAWVGESFAGDRCQSPPLPAAIDGARSTRAQVVAAMARAKSYEAAAGAFQACVGAFVAARHADGSRPLTEAQVIIENHRVLVSQRARERAQAQANAVVNAFNEYGSECPDHG